MPRNHAASRPAARTLRATIAVAWLFAGTAAGTAQLQPQSTERQSYVVEFADRSFDLAELRRAIRSRQDTGLPNIVKRFEAAVRRDQAAFATLVRRLGGSVTAQWWLVNGCAIDVAPQALARLRRAENVLRITPDRIRRPHLVEAGDNTHHGSAAANRMKDRTNTFITGRGVGVAVLDTGADVVSGTTNRPHACYYPGGDPTRNNNGGIQGSLLMAALKLPVSVSNDDKEGHGTAVAGCVGANKWNSNALVGNGVAPGAGIVSINITNSTGLSKDSWIVTAWQTIVSQRSRYSIGVGNNSFSGEPKLDNIVQKALDSAAHNGDMVITVSAGNFGTDTSESQYAYNGLAVGAIVKRTLVKSPTSAIGPLHQTRRTYPDLTAVGQAVVLPVYDAESQATTLSGTSYAAPMVAGAAALVRQAAPGLTANAVRAILLNTAQSRSGGRNHYGLGSLRADEAVKAALAGDVLPGAVSTTRPRATYGFRVATTGLHRVTATWMRTDLSAAVPPDLTLRIYDDQRQLVAKDGRPENSYESVEFQAVSGKDYVAEIDWGGASAPQRTIEFAIAGVTQRIAPTLATLAPTSVTAYRPVDLTLTGKGMATATGVRFGSIEVRTFQVLDDTRIRITPPMGMPIGPVAVRIVNPFGVSGPQPLNVTAPTDPILVGASPVTRGSGKVDYHVYAGRKWRSLLLVSDSNLPSLALPVFRLGIGNNWTAALLTLTYVDHDLSGDGIFQMSFPTGLPATTVYLQSISANPTAVTYPFPVSNVFTLRIQ